MGNKLPGGAKAAPPQTSLREATEALLTVPGGDGTGQGQGQSQGEQAKPSSALLMCWPF